MALFDHELQTRNGKALALRQGASQAQRMRILAAAVEIASEHGTDSATVALIIRRAGVSRRTFYGAFEDRQDCLDAVFEQGVAIATKRARAACGAQVKWVDKVRAGLLALLELFDEEPELARLCVAHAVASPSLLIRRGQVLDGLIGVIDEGRRASRVHMQPQPLAAGGILAGALGLIHTRLVARDRRPLVELLNPLMSMIVLPYLGAAAARKEQERSIPARRPAPRPRKPGRDPLAGLGMRLTYRTLEVLAVIDAEPGLSNCEVSERAGVKDQGQISKLLARLVGHGLTENTGAGQPRGEPNAWVLTLKGAELVRAVGGPR